MDSGESHAQVIRIYKDPGGKHKAQVEDVSSPTSRFWMERARSHLLHDFQLLELQEQQRNALQEGKAERILLLP